MAESYVQLPPDGIGKKIRSKEKVVGANTVHMEGTVSYDEDGVGLYDGYPVVGAGRRALREEGIGWQNSGAIGATPNRGLGINWYGTVATGAIDPDLILPYIEPEALRTFQVYEGSPQIRTKRVPAYGSFSYQAQLPPWADPSWEGIWLMAEGDANAVGGLVGWRFHTQADRVGSWVSAIPTQCTADPGRVHQRVDDILTVFPTLSDPLLDDYITKSPHVFTTKINRASIEYWIQREAPPVLIGIVQFSTQSDNYDVRQADPYVLHQRNGITPTHLPGLIEMSCGAGHDGERPGLLLHRWSINDGDPAPERSLHPIVATGSGLNPEVPTIVGDNWEGTEITDGTMISDKIPVAGYDRRSVQFRATVQGDLEIYGDYGDNSLDFLESFAVMAGAHKTYPIEAEPLWVQLVYDPDTYPATVTRARVRMR